MRSNAGMANRQGDASSYNFGLAWLGLAAWGFAKQRTCIVSCCGALIKHSQC